jgi:hypothetical protein
MIFQPLLNLFNWKIFIIIIGMLQRFIVARLNPIEFWLKVGKPEAFQFVSQRAGHFSYCPAGCQDWPDKR